MDKKAKAIEERILDVLGKAEHPLKAKEIARRLNKSGKEITDRSSVNRVLYGILRDRVQKDPQYRWFLTKTKSPSAAFGKCKKSEFTLESDIALFASGVDPQSEEKSLLEPQGICINEDMTGNFQAIQHRFLKCSLDIKCEQLCTRIMGARKESVGDKGWYYNPPAEYLGNRYNGIVIMGGNPGVAKNLEWNKKTRDAVSLYLKTPTPENAGRVNDVIRGFIPNFGVVIRGNLAYERWGLKLEEFAYINAFKCRTKNNANVFRSPEILSPCVEAYMIPQMRHLKPKLVIYLWKGHYDAIRKMGLDPGFGGKSCYRSGRRDQSEAEREAGHRAIQIAVRKVIG